MRSWGEGRAVKESEKLGEGKEERKGEELGEVDGVKK